MAGCLGGRHFQGLLVDHQLRLHVPAKPHAHKADEAYYGAYSQGAEPYQVVFLVAASDFGVADHNFAVLYGVDAVFAAAPQLVPGDSDHEPASDLDSTEDHVGEGQQRGVIGEHSPDIDKAGAAVDHFNADGVLHPRVRGEDEVRRDP